MPEITRLVFGCERMTNQRLTVWQQITVEFSGHLLIGSIVGMAGGVVWLAYGLQLRPVQESLSNEAYAENI